MSAAKAWRLALVAFAFVVIAALIVGKMFHLFVKERDFLVQEGEARSIRSITLPGQRGMITDRHGKALAISAPVATIWADPKHVKAEPQQLRALADLLSMGEDVLSDKIFSVPGRRFVYLARQISPEIARHVRALKTPGIYVEREFRRFFPSGEAASHVLGFTNMDNEGQEGLELALDRYLQGTDGAKRVLKDRIGRTIRSLDLDKAAEAGQDIRLSLDLRLQYVAYRELLAAVQSHQADSGSVVILDARNGEILAMVNQPSFNPNDRMNWDINGLRNRAVTDTLEPGSTMKPITIAAALMSGQYTKDSVIDTSPGWMRLHRSTIRDHLNYGPLDLTSIITKSSNIGVTKLTLSMEHDRVSNLMRKMGIGETTGSGFPGERTGVLPYINERQTVERATQSYGYGLTVTPLQLAQSYIPFANGGLRYPVSFLPVRGAPKGERVMPEHVAKDVLAMMETVTGRKGTGQKAAVLRYRVAGKTGTAHKAIAGGYADDRYVSVFSGILPVSDPRLVIVVVVDNPKGQEYYGGLVAAPVFSRVATDAMRLLNVAPDNVLEPE